MKTILVVDDDQMFRTVMKRHLTGMGFSVLENDSGVGVNEQITQHKPEACLIDIVMDNKEGLETIIEIMNSTQRPKVIAVSSEATYLGFAKDFGADATLLKPISLEILGSTLSLLDVRAQ